MRRLKDDETGAAPNWNLGALVPALLLKAQGDFQQALLGWEVFTSPLPDNKTELCRSFEICCCKELYKYKVPFFLPMINAPLKSPRAAQMIPTPNGDSWLIDVRGHPSG